MKQDESTDIGLIRPFTYRQGGFIDYMQERIWKDLGIPHIQLYIDPKTDFTDCPVASLSKESKGKGIFQL